MTILCSISNNDTLHGNKTYTLQGQEVKKLSLPQSPENPIYRNSSLLPVRAGWLFLPFSANLICRSCSSVVRHIMPPVRYSSCPFRLLCGYEIAAGILGSCAVWQTASRLLPNVAFSLSSAQVVRPAFLFPLQKCTNLLFLLKEIWLLSEILVPLQHIWQNAPITQ